MLKVENIKKKFTKLTKGKKQIEFYANNGISLEAHDGEIIGILGPNGAGKTTLLRIIAGILEPTSGSIFFDNLNYHDNETEIKKNIAYLSGNTKIYNTLSCYELLHMCADIYDVEKSDAEKRIMEIAKILNMESFLYNRIGSLSTGQTQRVNIARCLIHNPKYYILDEATSGLDIISSQIILNFIKDEKKKDKTILYSTHYMEEAQNLCNRVALMDHGKLEEVSTPQALIESLGAYAVDEMTADGTQNHYFHTRQEAIRYLEELTGQASLRETTLEDVFVERAGKHLISK